MSKIFIQTRGKLIDYGFLVESPKDSWWRNYDELTSFEHPTLIIERIDDYCHIYLSAIPSERKDQVQTIIRYTLAIELDDKSNVDAFLRLVSIWLDEVAQADKNRSIKSKIGSLLDKLFPEEKVEELLTKEQKTSEFVEDMENILTNFINDIVDISTTEKEIMDTDKYKVWWGGVGNEKSRQTWILLVDKLLRNEIKGKALLLNLAEANDLEHLCSKDENNQNIGLLIRENDDQPEELKPDFTEKKKIKLFSLMKGRRRKYLPLSIVGFSLISCVSFGWVGPNYFKVNSLSNKENNAIQVVSKSCPKATSTLASQDNNLTLEQLANQLGVSEDDILSQSLKCNNSFKKWSESFGKGTWDFQVEKSASQGSRINRLKFNQVN